jgi:hypothetical protein
VVPVTYRGERALKGRDPVDTLHFLSAPPDPSLASANHAVFLRCTLKGTDVELRGFACSPSVPADDPAVLRRINSAIKSTKSLPAALKLVEDMAASNIAPNEQTYVSLMLVCRKQRQAERALVVYEAMKAAAVPAGLLTFNLLLRCTAQVPPTPLRPFNLLLRCTAQVPPTPLLTFNLLLRCTAQVRRARCPPHHCVPSTCCCAAPHRCPPHHCVARGCTHAHAAAATAPEILSEGSSLSPGKRLHHLRGSRHAMVPLSDTCPHPEG